MNYRVLTILVEDENGIHALFGFNPEDEKTISELECESSLSDYEGNLDDLLEDVKAELRCVELDDNEEM